MKSVDYSMYKKLDGVSFQDTVDKVTAELKEEGFGVLTTIDVKATLKEKIDVDFKAYTILGACNPALAHQALSNDDNVGLFLPCNVVVSETDEGSEIGIINPILMMSMVNSPGLEEVAEEANGRLTRVFGKL
jgi:uncharacterized protein (DUF302 family)